MRIAHLVRFVSRFDGGIFFALAGLIPRLAGERGVSLRIFGAVDEHTAADAPQLAPAATSAFAPWPPRSFGYSPKIVPAVREYAPELLHTHGLWAYPNRAALRLHRKTGGPLVISPHGMLDPWTLAHSATKKRVAAAIFQNAQLRAASAIHALNLAEARAIRAYGIDRPIFILPNGVELPPPVAAPDNVPAGSRRRTLLFLGRLHRKKGLEALLEAWGRFVHSDPAAAGWRLVVAGWGDSGYDALLREKAAGHAASVEFAGALWGKRKTEAYASADAFILPSHSEGLPIAVLEAWAHRRPALLTAACNLPEGFASGAALAIKPNPASIAAGLLTLAKLSDADRQRMGDAGRRLVESRFTWPQIAADLTRVYSALIARQPIPPDLAFSES